MQVAGISSTIFDRFLGGNDEANANANKKNVPVFPKFNMETQNFNSYSAQLREHFKAYGVTESDQKRSFFISLYELYELVGKLFGIENFESKSFEEIVQKLSDYFKSKIHILAARYTFHNRRMNEGESYANWIVELRGLARNCAFSCKNSNCNSDFVDEMIRDAVTLHSPHESVRTAALQKQNPTLTEVIGIAETYESAQKSLSTLKGNNVNEVNFMKPQYMPRNLQDKSQSNFKFHKNQQQKK